MDFYIFSFYVYLMFQEYFIQYVAAFFQAFHPIKLWNHCQAEDWLLNLFHSDHHSLPECFKFWAAHNVKTEVEFSVASTINYAFVAFKFFINIRRVQADFSFKSLYSASQILFYKSKMGANPLLTNQVVLLLWSTFNLAIFR